MLRDGENPRQYESTGMEVQNRVLAEIVAADPDLLGILAKLRESRLPDAWLVSGAVYGAVWNVLTGRLRRHGIKDYDLIYFDADLSWDAEDAVIQRVAPLFEPLGLPVEIRNQARVHLWFEERFGMAYPKLTHATQSLEYYSSKTHSVAVRLNGDDINTVAPFGLDYVFGLKIVPNPVLANQGSYSEKASRAKLHWPELEVIAWPDKKVTQY